MEGYQLNYSKINNAVLDPLSRERKYRKMISVIRDYYGEDLSNLRCLEVGASGGIITSLLSDDISDVVGLDIDADALHSASKNSKKSLNYVIGDGLNLPFKDSAIDLVICNHIYEHVPNADQLFHEIYRVLSDGGFCYMAAGNKLMVYEGHYHLPFLSWLPKPVAHCYLKLTGRGDHYYENHLSYIGLKKLLKNFNVIDYTLEIIYYPRRFAAEELFDQHPIAAKIPKSVFRILHSLIPTYIFILTKKHA